MNYLKRTCTALAVLTAMLALSTVITACNGSADAATTGVTMAQVNAAIADAVAPLKTQIADQAKQIKALQGSSGGAVSAKLAHLYAWVDAPNVKVASSSPQTLRTQSYGDSHSSIQTAATDTGCTGLGTFRRHDGNKIDGISCTGYRYTIYAALDGETTHLISRHWPVYAQADCAGPAYVRTTDLTKFEIQGGVVSALPDRMVSDWSDPANYWYLPPHPTATHITVVSAYDPAALPNGCAAVGPNSAQVYAVLPLPAEANPTQVPPGLIPGPVGMGTIQ